MFPSVAVHCFGLLWTFFRVWAHGLEMSRRYDRAQSTDENLLQLPEFMYAKRMMVVENPEQGKCGILALLAFRDSKPHRGSEEIET